MIDVPFKISFKYMEEDEYLKNFISRKITRLERIYNRMITGSAHVEKNGRRNETGGVFTVRLEMFVPPRKELIVKKKARINSVFPKLTPLITDAFEAAENELQKEKTSNKGKHAGHRAGITRTAAGFIPRGEPGGT